MKKYITLLIILGLVGIGIVLFMFNRNKTQNNPSDSSYNSERVSTNKSPAVENSSSVDQANSVNSENTIENNTNTQSETTKKETETQISEFSTKIYTKDKERQNNINITCSTLNDTYVENGDTFSFCNTVGKATTSKGYKKAEVFKDGEVIQALGGGNCQVSTTLYNAVLKVDGLDVTERHKHSNSVPYIKKGKDAAVAYGSYDFKFINNTGNKIKIAASCDSDYVYIKLFKLE